MLKILEFGLEYRFGDEEGRLRSSFQSFTILKEIADNCSLRVDGLNFQ